MREAKAAHRQRLRLLRAILARRWGKNSAGRMIASAGGIQQYAAKWERRSPLAPIRFKPETTFGLQPYQERLFARLTAYTVLPLCTWTEMKPVREALKLQLSSANKIGAASLGDGPPAIIGIQLNFLNDKECAIDYVQRRRPTGSELNLRVRP